MNQPNFTIRQQEVIDLLLQGKGNKNIALALGISERTVEDHLNHIYTILGVSSRAEAIVQLGKSTGGTGAEPAESTVSDSGEKGYGNEKLNWIYEREAKLPEDHTAGQTIPRSNASGLEVHGQFGAVPAWPAQPGYVRYGNIDIPKTNLLYLKLRYSKYSASSVQILVFLDNEPKPRDRIFPEDQGSWNHFTWTEPILLGEVESGIHSLTFYTDGQEYGVADLDKFILTTEPA